MVYGTGGCAFAKIGVHHLLENVSEIETLVTLDSVFTNTSSFGFMQMHYVQLYCHRGATNCLVPIY